jgi:hypothetical protein
MTPDERAKFEGKVVQHNEMRTDLTAPASEFDPLPSEDRSPAEPAPVIGPTLD